MQEGVNYLSYILIITLVVSTVLFSLVFFVMYAAQRSVRRKDMELYSAVIETQYGEQLRIGNDLHDIISPKMSGVYIQLTELKKNIKFTKGESVFDAAMSHIKEMSEEVRSISHNLVSREFEKLGLVQALDAFCSSVDTSQLSVKLNVGDGVLPMKNIGGYQLYKVVVELVNNALKHSQATEIGVRLFAQNTSVYLSVIDNGVGLQQEGQLEEGVGWKSIRTRVKMFKGKIQRKGNYPRGLEVMVEVPIKNLKL